MHSEKKSTSRSWTANRLRSFKYVSHFPGECFYYLHAKYLKGVRSQPGKPLDKSAVPT